MKYIDLIEQLPAQDKVILKNYINTYGIVEEEFIGLDNWLQNWSHSKQNLYKLLGNNFIVKFPIEFEKSSEDIYREIGDKLINSDFKATYHEFYWDIIKNKYFSNNLIDDDNVLGFSRITDISCFKNNKIEYGIKWKKPGCNKVLQIQSGEKPMRALLKIINYFKDDFAFDMKEFEKFRLTHSLIFNDKILKGNMCISIHPLDFITMSDNACDWNSCMSWANEGCYHEGTIEMMNSNNTLCCYLESSTPYCFNINKENSKDYTWNNKKWRVLAYITKDIIMSGKSYPYEKENFSLIIINKIKELAKENLNWNYTFGPERYLDMIHINSAASMDRARGYMRYNPRKHNILWDTKGMYNDMLNANGVDYWCYRNKVNKTKIISVSGKAPCLCCGGSVINEESWAGEYNERYSNANNVVCRNCLDDLCSKYYCDICGKLYLTTHTNNIIINEREVNLCDNCVKEYVKLCPCCGKPFVLAESFYNYRYKFNIYISNYVDYIRDSAENLKKFHKSKYNDFIYSLDQYGGRQEIEIDWLDKQLEKDKKAIEQIYVCMDCSHKLKEEADYVLEKPAVWFSDKPSKDYIFNKKDYEKFRYHNLKNFS